jgi:histidinol phosphatase-like enzyme (inositol monophosphatase family)
LKNQSTTLSSLLEFALDAAWGAGRITLGYFQAGVEVERKGDNSPVTLADKAAEQFLRKRITEAFPKHGIIGEEFGWQAGDGNLTWIIDPIDGTKSFIHGVPLYGCLLALVDQNAPPEAATLVGIAHFPALNETIYAAQSEGCFWNGRRAYTSTLDTLNDATLLFSDVIGYRHHQGAFEELIAATYIQRTWGDSYGYALVSTGRADIMVDPIMNIWDCAPFGVILPEAGGTFTDWNGNSTIAAGESIATNGALFESVLRVTQGS